MRQSHLILSNAVIMWGARVLLLAPQLILVPYLLRTIGESGYGVYVLVWSLVMSIEQLQMSLQSGVVKYSAGFLAQGRMDEVNKIVSSSFVYSILLAVLSCAGTFVTAAFYNDSSGQVGSALIVVGVMILFIVPLTPYVAVIQSMQRYYVGAITETVSRYISLLAVVIWFHMVAPSVEALIVIMAGMLFLSRLAQVPVAYRIVPGLQNHMSGFDRTAFRLIASFGTAIVLASACLVANSTGVRWMMGILVSPNFVAHLAIMLMPGLLLSQIIGAMTITVMPATSAYDAVGNRHMLQELLIRGTRYTAILALAGVMVAGLLMQSVLMAWVGPQYAFLAPYALVLFATASFMLSTSTAHHMLKGLGKLRSIIFIYLVGLVILPISIILAVFLFWHDPYLAVTSGLAVGNIVCGCLQLVACAKALDTKVIGGMLRRAYVQPLIVTLIVLPVCLGMVIFGPNGGLIGRTFVSILSVFFFFVASYAFIATAEEQQQVKESIQLVLKRSAALLGARSTHQEG